jgi:hypothetical protein
MNIVFLISPLQLLAMGLLLPVLIFFVVMCYVGARQTGTPFLENLKRWIWYLIK